MYRRILVAFDGSAAATRAVMTALDLARTSNAEVRVLCVAEPLAPLPPDSGWELSVERLCRDQRLGGWLKQATECGYARGIPVRLAVATGTPGRAIARYAARRGSDLLVVGRHRDGGWRGGTVGWLSRHAPCPMLIVT